MDEKNGKKEIWKFALFARRAIDRRGGTAEGSTGGPGKEDRAEDEELLDSLSESFSGIPGPKREEELKSAVLERAPRPMQETFGIETARKGSGRRAATVLAKAGIALALILAMFIGMGFASVSAMPGNPLYSVKRVMEDARVSLASSGEGTAEQLLNNAEKRLDEIEYVRKKGMKGWDYALAGDAEADMERAYKEVGHMCTESSEKVCSRAGKCHRRLKSLIEDSSQELTPEQEQQLHHRMRQFENELDGSPESGPDSSSGSSMPAGNKNAECGCEQEGESQESPGKQGGESF